ncbi:hypothetical protein HPB49_005994 [Dermacentor silvarum]|uniref:Uncharacterized protein n=1 Tax=Dermacentor silvarum TaxID=543639 RepID=A0ACB8D341_DERSI|nr:hypothetical protein HPB49_005994 [Dermacentor silvarum]
MRAGFVWSVSDSDTLSDHRYIEFSFSGMTGVRQKRLTNFARAQILDSLNRSVWFYRVIGCRFSSSMTLDLEMEQSYRIYDALHKHNLRVVKAHVTSGNAWWTPQLAAERSRCMLAPVILLRTATFIVECDVSLTLRTLALLTTFPSRSRRWSTLFFGQPSRGAGAGRAYHHVHAEPVPP